MRQAAAAVVEGGHATLEAEQKDQRRQIRQAGTMESRQAGETQAAAVRHC